MPSSAGSRWRPRSRQTPTSCSAPAPSSRSRWAMRLASASSRPYVRSWPSKVTATASGAAAARSSNASWTRRGSSAAAGARGPSAAGIRSAGSLRGTAESRVRGSAVTAVRSAVKWRAIRSTVAWSKRAVAYSNRPSSAPFSPSSTWRCRSKRATRSAVPKGVARTPGRSKAAARGSWSVNAVWNSGVRDRSRSGWSSSTSRPNGVSWWSKASRTVERARPRRCSKRMSPSHSQRRTRLLMP